MGYIPRRLFYFFLLLWYCLFYLHAKNIINGCATKISEAAVLLEELGVDELYYMTHQYLINKHILISVTTDIICTIKTSEKPLRFKE